MDLAGGKPRPTYIQDLPIFKTCRYSTAAGLPVAAGLQTKQDGTRERVAPGFGGVMTGFDIFAIALVLLVCFTLYAGVKTVPQGYDWTIERFGKFTRTLSPGLNIIIPYFDRVGRKMNMMEQVISIPEQEVITKDNATVTVDGVAFYQVFDAAKASYEVSDLDRAIIV